MKTLKSVQSVSSFAAQLAVRLLGLVVCGASFLSLRPATAQTTATWVGTDGNMSTASNWSPDAVPSTTTGDTMRFAGGGVSTVFFPGSTFSGDPGLGGLLVTADQIAPLAITNSGSAAVVFRLGANAPVTIEAGAGAFSFGDGGNAFILNLSNSGEGNRFTNNSASLATIGSQATFSATSGTNGRAIFDGSGGWLVSGGLGSAVSQGLVKQGAGTLTLSGANQYTGGTTVTEGTLRLASTGGAGSGAVALAGGTLSLFRSGGTTTYANAIGVAAGQEGTLRVDGSGSNLGTGNNSTYATGTITANGTLTVSRPTGGSGNTIFSGLLAGSGTLVVDNTNGGVTPVSNSSSGRALFSGASNTFSGDVVIQNGGNFLNNTANPSYSSVAIGGDSLLTLVTNNSNSTTIIGTLSGAGTVIKNTNHHRATLSVAAGDFSGVISSGSLFGGSGGFALTKTGSGTLSLSGANLYTGATTVSGGTLQIGNGGAAGSLSPTTAISVATDATLAFNRSDAITQGTNFNSVISGFGGVAQLGSGTLTLSGTNTYSGRTLVSAGVLTLGVNGSFASSNEIRVGGAGSSGAILDLTAKTGGFSIGAASQLLGGGGTVRLASNGTLNVLGTFSPGNSPGLFTFDAGTTVLSGTTLMEIFGTSRATSPSHGAGFYDAVDIVNTGILQFGGILTLEFSSLFDDNTTFNLFTPEPGSALAGNFTNVNVNGSFYDGLTWNPTDGVWKSSNTAGGQSLEFSSLTGQLVIVPEPSTIALLAVCGGFALLRRNRWRPRRRWRNRDALPAEKT